MNKFALRILLRNFTSNSTLHGLFYLNETEKKFKAIWIVLILLSTVLIILTLFLNLRRYLKFETYFLIEENQMDKYETLPSILVCQSNELQLTNSLFEMYPEYKSLNKSEIMRMNDTKKFDKMLIESFKNNFTSKKLFFINQCIIKKNDITFTCTDIAESIFTFYGLCWLIDLEKVKFDNSAIKKNDISLISYFEKPNFQLKLEIQQSTNKTFFKILPSKNLINSNYMEFKLLYFRSDFVSSNEKSYGIKTVFTEYSNALNDKHCSPDNDFNSCHFDCLQKLIIELVKCKFTHEPNENHTEYCHLNDLIFIEEIIKNYDYFRLKLGMKSCLPSCKSIDYEVNQIETGNQDSLIPIEFQKLNLMFFYNSLNKTYLLKFDVSQMLNFSNGLLSLFFGMSILSIIEIIELAYVLIRCCFKKNFKVHQKKPLKFYKPIIKIYKFLKIIFHDTYMHGFKYIFDDSNTRSKKFRWIFYLLIITACFCFVTKIEIDEYLKFQSDYRISKSNNPVYLDRNFSILACIPIKPRSGVMYRLFIKNSNDLFLNRTNFTLIKKQYESLFFSRLRVNKTYFTSNQNLSEMYNQLFFKINLTLKISEMIRLEKVDNYILSFDRTCSLFKINFSYSNWAYDHEYDKAFIFSGVNIQDKSQIDLTDIEMFVLDAESMYISEKSKYNLQVNTVNLLASLKYKKLLEIKEFKPICSAEKNYLMHDCYRNCLNDLINLEFGCKIWYYEENLDNKTLYCHPFMFPLFINYEKFILRNSITNICLHCKLPCETYYYEVDVLASVAFYFRHLLMHRSIEIIEQIQIRKFEQTFFILISFIGLFFGGSFLSLVQIIINIISSIKIKFNKKFIRHSRFLDLVSNSTTVHCIKYVSGKVVMNDLKRLFWIMVISLAVVCCFFYSIIELYKFYSSNQEVKLEEVHQSPKIDICFPNNPINSLPDETKHRKDVFSISTKLTLYSYEFDYSANSSNLKDRIKYFHKNYSDYIQVIKQSYSNVFDSISEIRYSKEMENFLKRENFILTNSINNVTTNKNYKAFIQQPGYFFTHYMEYQICNSIDLQLLLNDYKIKKNPFTSLTTNILEYKSDRVYHRTRIYIENIFLEPKDPKFGSEFGGLYMNLNSFIANYDYKYFCKDEKKCINGKLMLKNYSEFELFYCNTEFKDIIHDIFNCTPFISNNPRFPECSFLMIPLLSSIFSNYKKMLLKCEIIEENRDLIEFDETSLGINFRNRIFMDFNNARVYKQYVTESYDLLTLVINMSNFLSLFIGFSYLTIFEFFFIFVALCFRKRI
jgi:hypothetical protein